MVTETVETEVVELTREEVLERLGSFEEYVVERVGVCRELWEGDKPYLEREGERDVLDSLFDFRDDRFKSMMQVYEWVSKSGDEEVVERLRAIDGDIQRWNRLYGSMQRVGMMGKLHRDMVVNQGVEGGVMHVYMLQCDNTLESLNDLLLSEDLTTEHLDEVVDIYRGCVLKHREYLEWLEVSTAQLDLFDKHVMEVVDMYRGRVRDVDA